MNELQTIWKSLAIGTLVVLGLLFFLGVVNNAQADHFEVPSFAGLTVVNLEQIIDMDPDDDIAAGDMFEGPAESEAISLTFRWTVTHVERSLSNPDVLLITGNHECVACAAGTVGCNPNSPAYFGTFVTADRAITNKNDFGIALEAIVNANLAGGTPVPAISPDGLFLGATDLAFEDAPGGHFHGNGRVNFDKGTISFRSFGLAYFIPFP